MLKSCQATFATRCIIYFILNAQWFPTLFLGKKKGMSGFRLMYYSGRNNCLDIRVAFTNDFVNVTGAQLNSLGSP
jgi:hypothetical protein